MEIATVIIAAIGLFFAAVAAVAAWETVQDTRIMRWEANLSRVLEALTAIRRAARDMDPAHTNPNLSQWELQQRLKDGQQELDRALAFPRVLTDSREANDLLELLRTQDLVGNWARTDAYAMGATDLLSKQRPPQKLPGWMIRTMTFIPGERRKWRERKAP